jgi:hypothetical protein
MPGNGLNKVSLEINTATNNGLVIPAQAGIQNSVATDFTSIDSDSPLRYGRNDKNEIAVLRSLFDF